MSNQNALKNMAYDNPAYMSRGVFNSIMVAGSGGVSGKFVAHAALLLFGLNTYTTIAGTSTYTQTQYYNNAGTNTSQTVHANTTQVSLIRITNTAAFGTAVGLSTSTYGPFTLDMPYANGTGTGAVGVAAQFALNTSTGTAGLNGLAINQGDQIYLVNGTDATHVALVGIEYCYAPLANVIA